MAAGTAVAGVNVVAPSFVGADVGFGLLGASVGAIVGTAVVDTAVGVIVALLGACVVTATGVLNGTGVRCTAGVTVALLGASVGTAVVAIVGWRVGAIVALVGASVGEKVGAIVSLPATMVPLKPDEAVNATYALLEYTTT